MLQAKCHKKYALRGGTPNQVHHHGTMLTGAGAKLVWELL
jgi:hypothetical protein